MMQQFISLVLLLLLNGSSSKIDPSTLDKETYSVLKDYFQYYEVPSYVWKKNPDSVVTVYLHDSTIHYPESFIKEHMENALGERNQFYDVYNQLMCLKDSSWLTLVTPTDTVIPKWKYDETQMQAIAPKQLHIEFISSQRLRQQQRFPEYVNFFSKMYFDKQHTQCIFYRKSFRNGLDGSGSLQFMEKKENHWKRVYFIRLWHS